MLYEECYEQITSLFSLIKTHLGSDFEYHSDIAKMIDESKSKHYLLDDVFIVLCYVINNGDYPNISSSFSIRDFDFGELNRKLLLLIYEYYESNHSTERVNPEDIFTDQCNIFTECNTTFLQPTNNIVGVNEVKGAKVVKFYVRNCRNTVFDIKSIIDDEYIKSRFDGLSSTTGVNEKIIKRFSFFRDYEHGESSDKDFIIDAFSVKSINSTEGNTDGSKIYQKLDDKHYRELVNNPIHEKDYNLINCNLAVTNWENKRILANRRTIPKPIRAINHDVIRGSIKTNIYEKGMRISDAIFDSYKNPNMSDNDILQIAIGAHMYQDKHHYIKRAEFDKMFSIRDLEANII
jgi:hypothetical protein